MSLGLGCVRSPKGKGWRSRNDLNGDLLVRLRDLWRRCQSVASGVEASSPVRSTSRAPGQLGVCSRWNGRDLPLGAWWGI